MKSDKEFMFRCIELADKAAQSGDLPFGSIVVKDGEIVGEGHNQLQQKKEIYRHAEMLAFVQAQQKLDSRTLAGCVLYTTVEPCPMCSFAARELQIKQIFFGLRSPAMGGYSKWPILEDAGLKKLAPEFFAEAPEIVPDFLKEEVKKSWQDWNKNAFEVAWARGLLA